MPHPVPRDTPAFLSFLRRRFDGRAWCVVRSRRRDTKAAAKYEVLLLQREYSALIVEFNSTRP